jgi:hypothetical protein
VGHVKILILCKIYALTANMRGPHIIYDKSLLEALNPQEAAILDIFYTTNVTPILLLEIRADLSKNPRDNRTPKDLVRNLAYKLPNLHPYFNAYHIGICWAELLGNPIRMEYMPLIDVRPQTRGLQSDFYPIAEEANMIERWRNENFSDDEIIAAGRYRDMLAGALRETTHFEAKFDTAPNFKQRDWENIKKYAEEVVQDKSQPYSKLKWLFEHLCVPEDYQERIIKRWKDLGGPSLLEYAPYTAYVVTLDLFTHTALATQNVSNQRHSDKIDMAYLYYLPFTEIFVSDDKLHKKIVPHFLTGKQIFISKDEFKADLQKLDKLYASHPDIKTLGLMGVAKQPPTEGDFAVTKHYDIFRAGWRHSKIELPPEVESKIIEMLELGEGISVPSSCNDSKNTVVERKVPKNWGKYTFYKPNDKST